MRLLLDTHIVLWQRSGRRTLGEKTREALAAASEVAFSVVSFAEIGVKVASGKLTVPDDFYPRVLDSGVRIHGLSAEQFLDAVQRGSRATQGTFRIRLRGSTGPLGSPNHVARGRWHVLDGTGAYAGLEGGGELTAVTNQNAGALTALDIGEVRP